MGLVLQKKGAPPATGSETRPWFRQPASDQAPVDTGTEPVRFYIVHEIPGQGEIKTSDYVRTSPFAMIQQNWREALPEMARRYPHRGDSLEIDCHGKPGALLLWPELNHNSLPAFASAACELLQPYKTVEFLACKVASYDVAALARVFKLCRRDADAEFLTTWLRDSGGSGFGDGRVGEADTVNGISDDFRRMTEQERKWEAARLLRESEVWPGLTDEQRQRLVTDYINEQLQGGRGARQLVLTNKFTGAKVAKPAWPSGAKLDHVRVARLAMETGLLTIGNCYNGPLFCSRAARMLRCTVRAGMPNQPGAQTSGMGLGEFLRTHDYSAMPIGNWQGHIFDFAPGGGVSYVGLDVPRGTYVPFIPGGDGPLRNA
jgi:hypothetical protein